MGKSQVIRLPRLQEDSCKEPGYVGQEVLELFSTFHAEGKSILMVTYDVQVASRAECVLFMKDGLLVGELKQKADKKEGLRQIQEAVNSL